MIPRPIGAIPAAFRHWQKALFEPFKFSKWAWWAFVAMAAGVGGGGGGGGNNIRVPSGKGGDNPFAELNQHLGVDLPALLSDIWSEHKVVLLICAGLLVLLAVVAMYFASVFRFVFLDNIIKNESAVSKPFNEYHAQGLSYFAFWLVLALCAIVFIVGPAAMLGWQAFQGGDMNIAAIIALVAYLVGAALVLAFIDVFAYDFAMPAMYLRRTGILRGWVAFFELAAANPLRMLGYIGMKLLILFAFLIPSFIAVIILLIVFLLASLIPLGLLGVLVYFTWSLTWIYFLAPLAVIWIFLLCYVLTFAILPMAVFSRCYSLAYLETYGEEWRTISPPPPPPPAFAPSSPSEVSDLGAA